MRKSVLLVIFIVTIIVAGYSAVAHLTGYGTPSTRHDEWSILGIQLPFWPILVFAAVGFGAGAAAYYVIFPEIASRKETDVSKITGLIDAVMMVLEPDEQRIVEALKEAGGNMCQNEVAKKVGYSRVKAHRTIARLAKRGVILIEKLGAGKTNRISISPWLLEIIQAGHPNGAE